MGVSNICTLRAVCAQVLNAQLTLLTRYLVLCLLWSRYRYWGRVLFTLDTFYALGASTLHEWVYLHIACSVRPGLECTIDLCCGPDTGTGVARRVLLTLGAVCTLRVCLVCGHCICHEAEIFASKVFIRREIIVHNNHVVGCSVRCQQ